MYIEVDKMGITAADFAPVTSLSNEGWWSAACPFPVAPRKYVEYARLDLETACQRGDLNAFHNAKRAIDCQVDSILHNLGLLRSGLRSPEKFALLDRVGANAPKVLQKLIRQRNLLEHEFESTSRPEAEDAVDIAELFIQATRLISDVRHKEWVFWCATSKIGGSCKYLYESDCSAAPPEKYFDLPRAKTDDDRPPAATALEVYRSTRKDDHDPRALIWYRGEYENYFDLTDAEIAVLRQSCPELFYPERNIPDEESDSEVAPQTDWPDVIKRVGQTEVGYSIVCPSQKELYLSITAMMVHGMKNWWSE